MVYCELASTAITRFRQVEGLKPITESEGISELTSSELRAVATLWQDVEPSACLTSALETPCRRLAKSVLNLSKDSLLTLDSDFSASLLYSSRTSSVLLNVQLGAFKQRLCQHFGTLARRSKLRF